MRHQTSLDMRYLNLPQMDDDVITTSLSVWKSTDRRE